MLLARLFFIFFVSSVGLPVLIIGLLGFKGKFDEKISSYLEKKYKVGTIQSNYEGLNEEIKQNMYWVNKIWLFLIGFSVFWFILSLLLFIFNYF